MDIQLKELVEKIKNEGVAAAESEAKKIITTAEEKAKQIIQNAKSEAEQYKLKAEQEIEKQEVAGRDALKQAARDTLIGLEQQIIKLFEAVISETVEKTLTADFTKKLIMEMPLAWAEKGEEGIKIVLSSKDAKELESGLISQLSKRFKEGIEIVPSPKFSKGFRIGGSDGALYNFTAEGIAEVLAETLSPSLATILREAISS